MTMKVGKIDAVGIYWGMEEIEPDAFDPAKHVDAQDFFGDCDLPPGRYRWNAGEKAFEPLPSEQIPRAPATPSFERAMADFVAAQQIAGTPLPKNTVAWLEHFMMTINAR